MPTTSLADELMRLRLAARLRPSDLARLSGVHRGTIYAIESGRTRMPFPAVLRDLANGLATDPYTKAVDAMAADAALVTLMEAAGYPLETPHLQSAEPPGKAAEDLLAEIMGSRQAGYRFASLARDYPEMTPSEQKFLAALTDLLAEQKRARKRHNG